MATWAVQLQIKNGEKEKVKKTANYVLGHLRKNLIVKDWKNCKC